jgi:hypothetical protein
MQQYDTLTVAQAAEHGKTAIYVHALRFFAPMADAGRMDIPAHQAAEHVAEHMAAVMRQTIKDNS